MFLALVGVAEKKSKTPAITMCIMGLYASFWIALGAMLAIFVCATSQGGSGFKSFAFGALFPLGLILIFFVGAELFTGDTMYMAAGLLARKTTWFDLMKVWAIAWLFNFFGGALMAYFFGYLTDFTDAPITGPLVKQWLIDKTRYKVRDMGWGVVFLKGILCNTLVNCAVWGAGVCDDTFGKIMAIWWPIMAFAACGYEHSVANMFMCTLGLMVGAGDTKVDFGYFLIMNLVPATLGNIFGGSVAMALAWWYCYSFSPPGSLDKGAFPAPASAPYGVPPQPSPTSMSYNVPMSPSKMTTA